MTYARLLQDYQAQNGYQVTVGPPGGAWGQFPASYHVQAVGAIGTMIYTFSPNLINELSWGINRGKQGVNPLDDASSNPNNGGARTYQDSLLPLKDASGKALTLPRINQGSNVLGLLPAVNFGFPSTGFSAQSSGQGITGAPTFSNDSRWPFTGTDQLQTLQDKITWVKGAHTVKAGFYYERMARNVSVYSVYNAAGTYYFGSDRASSLDTNYPYSNALLGSIFAYGDDNTKLVNHAHYSQFEWYVQDTWKISRRLTLDYGLRFYRVGDLNSARNTLGLFDTASYDRSKAGQLLYPACAVQTSGTCPTASKIAINPVTGRDLPVRPAGHVRYLVVQHTAVHRHQILRHPLLQRAPDSNSDRAWALRGTCSATARPPCAAATASPSGATGTWTGSARSAPGQGPLMVPPNFLAPTILYTSFQNLASSQSYFTPQNPIGGDPNEKPQTDLQLELRHPARTRPAGMIADVSYVGNALKNGYGQMYDGNAVAPLTTWKPSGCANPIQGGCPQSAFVDPTTNPSNPGYYSTNLIRNLVGYKTDRQYHRLHPVQHQQLQLAADAVEPAPGKHPVEPQLHLLPDHRLQQQPPTRTLFQFVDAKLMKNITNRPHAVNFNMGYDFPSASQHFTGDAGKKVAKVLLDGWHLNGNGAIYSGTPYTVTCGATGAPSQYWTGTPTAYMPFRCHMGTDIFLPTARCPRRPRIRVCRYR